MVSKMFLVTGYREKTETDLDNETDQLLKDLSFLPRSLAKEGSCRIQGQNSFFWKKPILKVLKVFLLGQIPVGDVEGNFLIFIYDQDRITGT